MLQLSYDNPWRTSLNGREDVRDDGQSGVDVAKKIVAVDMDMHADGEAYLLERGSQQADLWGINLHLDKFGTDEFIEFDSMINIRPRQNNPSRDVLDLAARQQIIDIIAGVVRE